MAISQKLRDCIVQAIGDTGAGVELANAVDASSVLSSTEAGYLDSVTAGTGAASKAVVLDANGDWFGPNNGGIVLGHTAQETVSNGDGATNLVPELQLLGTGMADSSILLGAFSTTATRAAAPTLALVKGGDAAIGTHTIVTDDEVVGNVIAFADDGVDLETPIASIQFVVDGTPAADQVGGSIEFYTTPDGSTTLTERARLTSGGDLRIANGGGIVVGHTAQVPVGAVTSELEVLGTAPADSTMSLQAWSADAVPPRLYFAKSRSATIGTFSIITSGDNLGEILAFGDDGVDFNSNANASCGIIFDSAGTIAADRIAGVIRLQTATDAAPSVLTTALTIDQAQLVTCAAGLTLTTGDLTFSAASDIVVQANTAAAVEVSDATTKILAVDSRNTIKNVNGVTISSPATTIASETAAHENPSLKLANKTITYTGTTGTTSQFGAMLNVGVLTLTDASVMTLAAASAVHINAVAAAGGSLTLSAAYMISTSVSDCYLTNAGAWTDTMCWSRNKDDIADADSNLIARVLDKLTPRSWKYGGAGEHGDDFGRERVGIVYDELPDELRAPGQKTAVGTGILSSFALAALKMLRDENEMLKARLDRLELSRA